MTMHEDEIEVATEQSFPHEAIARPTHAGPSAAPVPYIPSR